MTETDIHFYKEPEVTRQTLDSAFVVSIIDEFRNRVHLFFHKPLTFQAFIDHLQSLSPKGEHDEPTSH